MGGAGTYGEYPSQTYSHHGCVKWLSDRLDISHDWSENVLTSLETWYDHRLLFRDLSYIHAKVIGRVWDGNDDLSREERWTWHDSGCESIQRAR